MTQANLSWIRPVRFPLALLPGESIRGYAARVAEHNTYDRAAQLLDAVDVNLNDLWTGTDPTVLSAFYKVELPAMEHALSRRSDGGNSLTLFGASYPKYFIRTKIRPVSPSGLRRSKHHRFAWSLRPLAFCPEDFSLLIFECPPEGCGESLVWRDRPLHLCPFCNFDLRMARTRKIPQDLRPSLGVAAGLMSFDPEVRRASLALLPQSLGSLAPFDAVQAVLVIGRALVEGEHPLARAPHLAHIDTAALSAGVSFLLEPDAWDRLGEVTRGAPPAFVAKTRAKLRSKLKWVSAEVRTALGPLQEETSLFRSPRADDRIINLTIAADMLAVDRKAAKQLLDSGILQGRAVGGGSERVLSEVDNTSLSKLIAEASARISVAQLAEQYRLKSSWINQMISLGLIDRARSPFIDAAYKDVQVCKTSAHAYLGRINKAVVRTAPGDPNRIPLKDAFVALGTGAKPWVQAIMAPRLLPDGLGCSDPDGFRYSALNVTRRCAEMLRSREFSFPPLRRLSVREITLSEAQEHLNCHPRDISELIKLGVLMRSESGLTVESVEACALHLISTGELAVLAEVPALDLSILAQQKGLQRPYSSAGFWDRAEAQAAFGLRVA